jgi:hypothetical protein
MARPIDLINQNLAETAAASIQAAAGVDSARIRSDADRYIADLQNRLGRFQTREQTGLGRYQADIGLKGTQYSSDADERAALGVAASNLRGTQYSADAQLRAALDRSQKDLQGIDLSSGRQLRAALGTAEIGAGAQRYAADVGLRGTQYQTDAQRAIAEGRLGYDYDVLGFRRDKFNEVFGALRPLFGQLGGGSDLGAFDQFSGVPISTSGVYTPQQIDQQAAALRGQQAGQAALQERQIVQGGAGRGISAQSPLLKLLRQNVRSRSAEQSISGERDLRLGAAKENAAQILQGQTAAADQRAQLLGLGVEAQRTRATAAAARLNALASILGAGLSS